MADIALDHLVWTSPSLAAGMARWAALGGPAARPGGAHPGNGTRNAIVPLAEGLYLEILCPDPEQTLEGTEGGEIAAQAGERLRTFCCRTADLTRIAARAAAVGLATRGPVPFSRTRPDGVTLRWSLLYLTGHGYGGLLPFFIDWEGSPHPSGEGSHLRLETLRATHPDAARLGALYAALELPLVARPGPAGLQARLSGGGAEIALAS